MSKTSRERERQRESKFEHANGPNFTFTPWIECDPEKMKSIEEIYEKVDLIPGPQRESLKAAFPKLKEIGAKYIQYVAIKSKLNESKTKGMIVFFKEKKNLQPPISLWYVDPEIPQGTMVWSDHIFSC